MDVAVVIQVQPQDWKTVRDITVGLWSVVGPLVGIFIGAYIANRNQRKHWIADNKKQEFRELLSALVEASSSLIVFYTPMVLQGPDEQRACDRAEKKSVEVIMDRIFIAREVKELDLQKRWSKALSEVRGTRNRTAFSDEFVKISSDITAAALKIVE
jgi:hypothetical protein